MAPGTPILSKRSEGGPAVFLSQVRNEWAEGGNTGTRDKHVLLHPVKGQWVDNIQQRAGYNTYANQRMTGTLVSIFVSAKSIAKAVRG